MSANNGSMSEMGTFMEHNKVGTAGFVILVVFIIGALASVYGIMGDIPRIAITISITMLVLISYLGLFPFKTTTIPVSAIPSVKGISHLVKIDFI